VGLGVGVGAGSFAVGRVGGGAPTVDVGIGAAGDSRSRGFSHGCGSGGSPKLPPKGRLGYSPGLGGLGLEGLRMGTVYGLGYKTP
jgi:hypothetical protein